MIAVLSVLSRGVRYSSVLLSVSAMFVAGSIKSVGLLVLAPVVIWRSVSGRGRGFRDTCKS